MNKLDIKKIVIIVIIYILIISFIILIDTLNISGFIFNKLNYNFLNIVVNILTTILLFCITYILVERKLMKIRAVDDLYTKSGELQQYKGYVVSEIDGRYDQYDKVFFTNG